jgi:hypothetical protein
MTQNNHVLYRLWLKKAKRRSIYSQCADHEDHHARSLCELAQGTWSSTLPGPFKKTEHIFSYCSEVKLTEALDTNFKIEVKCQARQSA